MIFKEGITLTYKEYKDKRQSEFNNLPIFFAFSNEQFDRAMRERGLSPDDTDKIYKLGMGGFYLRSDAEIIRAWFDTPDPIHELMENPEFAEDAFYYEMGNHEYHINHYQGDWDVCSCFGDCEWGGEEKTAAEYLKELGYSDTVTAAFNRAKRKFYKDCIDNDWF